MFIVFTEALHLKRVSHWAVGSHLAVCFFGRKTFIAVVTEAPLGRVQALRGEFFQFPLAYGVQGKIR